MVVVSPADEVETREVMAWSLDYDGPVFIRLVRDVPFGSPAWKRLYQRARNASIETGPDGGLRVNRFLQSTQHPDIFGEQDPWMLADSLLKLFDELTLHRVPVDAGLDEFYLRL